MPQATPPPTRSRIRSDFMSRVVLGRRAAESGDADLAERMFLGCFDEARSIDPHHQRLARASLITLYGRTNRLFEALVLARRQREDAAAAGNLPIQALAQAAICDALGGLRRDDALDRELAHMRTLIEGLSDQHRPDLVREYLAICIEQAIGRDALDTAAGHLAAYQAHLRRDPPPSALDRWVLWINQASWCRRMGDGAGALHALDHIDAEKLGRRLRHLRELQLRLEVYIDLGHEAKARETAARCLERLDAPVSGAQLCGDRIRNGAQIARILEERMGDAAGAHRAYEGAAASVLQRIVQLGKVIRRLPELDAEGDSAELIGYRKAFLAEQTELLGRVARLLQSHDSLRRLIVGELREGLLAVCAWCERVPTRNEGWLPIGHLVPREGAFRISHGICPSCSASMVPKLQLPRPHSA